MKKNLTAFKWDGKRSTVLNYMAKGAIKDHIKGIRLLDRALLIVNRNLDETHHKTVHVGNIVFELPNGDWTGITSKEWNKLIAKVRGI